MKDLLINKIKNREASIGVVGLGYVGLPLVLRYLDADFSVVGFDIDEEKNKALQSGKSYINHIDAEGILEKYKQKKFYATSDFSCIKDVDAIVICLPTPLSKHREPDLSYIVNSADVIISHMRPGQVLSLESTTYPGTTDEVLVPKLQSAGYTIGEDTFLVYSPEREDPGNPKYNTRTIPKICGGTTSSCLEVGVTLYNVVIDQVVPVSSTQVAEFVKILENTYRAVNIALVNELKVLTDRMGLDIFEIIKAASTKPFGFSPFYPGPGLGGHCLPIDPFYLTWKAKEFEFNTRFIELAGEVNSSMPDYVVQKVGLALNSHEKSIKSSHILILGIAYKKNVDDTRESPAVVLIDKLSELGANVQYSDPYVPDFPKLRKYHFDMKSVALTHENVQKFDCVLIVTDHDKFDWQLIEKSAKLIVDTRGVLKYNNKNIFLA
ncbi:nucleotide sugar dehydrogenase [Candidatus Uabimicrobium sp. HlEnr_7]|uniref:nucleotide sugar dehydrogenase n=1 Tax=Candidatus Uabimicrobium helgolandensis TaxID=3095367 RepID=UPI003558056E